ncbi:hypothetical protein RclHR1_06010001 [Rhizophagus clarus]|uniref:Protein kinase domain-containing protein n=1 Tax=Rhizophagus clarus TaxID=94130 RepID=A0A2Z6S751_9GLOM|nr:hypothetical protein RclHR1_06010001 [Rhizophagus clarus]
MEQLTNHKHKSDILLSGKNITITLSQPEQNTEKLFKNKKCNKCKRERTCDENEKICHTCFKIKTMLKSSGNKVIDDFIIYTQINNDSRRGKLEFVPYEQFKNIKFIARGGFSKIYKATWVDGPIKNWDDIKHKDRNIIRDKNYTVVLKELNKSDNITSEELNELKIFYQIYSDDSANNVLNKTFISKYFGITQDPDTKDIMIIMRYYSSGDLIHYINKNFYKINWEKKLDRLDDIIRGLESLHSLGIIHRDLHSGNILFSNLSTYIGDFGISKSAIESTDNNEIYGIIPYIAPEIFLERKYSEASDIYSFGMIMWEFMTGRRPFWDLNHDAYLIIDICDFLRPPIVTNAPDGYIDLMKECWHSDPEKRPTAAEINTRIWKMRKIEKENFKNNNPTKIIKSPDIGPVTVENNSGAIYKSRSLSLIIQSAISSRSLSVISSSSSRSQSAISLKSSRSRSTIFSRSSRSQSTNFEADKRKSKGNLLVVEGSNRNGYFTKEIEFDINISSNQPSNNGEQYVTKEIDLDINVL